MNYLGAHSGDKDWKGSEYFDLWENANENTANYKISGDAKLAGDKNDVISDGINSGSTESVYIQFKVKQSFLEDMLAGRVTNEQMSGAVTVSHAIGYHSYIRTDNVWSREESNSYYEQSTDADRQVLALYKEKDAFLHKTVDINKDSGALCLLFILGEPRVIAGNVFEDTITDESKAQNEGLGNGILDQNEVNRAQNVKVELIDASKVRGGAEDVRADLYVHSSSAEKGYDVLRGEQTIVTTDKNGYYQFEGVVPGLYCIRFTYSTDYSGEKTIIVDSQGNKVDDLTSNNYKSTIINTIEAGKYIQNAMESSIDNMSEYVNTYNKDTSRKDIQEYVEWYKYLYKNAPEANYNVATDNFEIRNNLGIYNYNETENGTEVTNSNGTKLENWPEVSSNSPYFSISIENDINDTGDTSNGYAHNPSFDRFNLGLLKTIETYMNVNKIISNVKVTNQVGTVLAQGDPGKIQNYITALDKLTKGSKYARIEMERNDIYGSAIETVYEITVKNDSVKDYIENEGDSHYGYYFKYGNKDNAFLKTVTVLELIDLIDKDYNLAEGVLNETVTHPTESLGGERTERNMTKVKMSIVQNGDEPRYLSFKDWSAIEPGGTSTIEYRVGGICQEDMDLSYDNNAKIVSIKLDTGSTLKTAYDWGDYSTTRLVVTPDTGEDRSQIYYIVGAIALVILATGIIIIKKRILD